jgi:ABC-type multidrug transport system ATPase subunit
MIPEEPSIEYAKFNLTWKSLRISIKRTGSKIIPNFSGSLQSGSLVAILGASGSGKTTFMNFISGYTRGDLEADCTLKMNGVRMTNIKALKRISGYVFQEDVLIPELTVYETLWYNAK